MQTILNRPASVIILLLNVVVFALSNLLSKYNIDLSSILNLSDTTISLNQPWRFVTYMFTNRSLIDLVLNCLIILGFSRVESIISSRNYLILFILFGIISPIPHLIFKSDPLIGMIYPLYGIVTLQALMNKNERIFFNIKLINYIKFIFVYGTIVEIIKSIYVTDQSISLISYISVNTSILLAWIIYKLDQRFYSQLEPNWNLIQDKDQ